MSQEGLARPSQTKQRIHLSAIAKTALRFSFLRFRARNSNAGPNNENETASNNEASDEDTVASIPNGHTVSKDRNRHFNLANVTRLTSIPTPKISIESPSVPDLSHLPGVSEIEVPQEDERLMGLEAKIRRIEDQVIQFRHTINSQMNEVLSSLADLKTTETNIKERTSEADSSGTDSRPIEIDSDLSTITTYF